MGDVNVLNWLESAYEKQLREEEIAQETIRRNKAWEDTTPERKAELHQMVVEYHHKYGWDYNQKERCYCSGCAIDKDWLDEYYNEQGQW